MTLPSTINYLVSNWADPGTVYNEGGDNVINGNFTVTSGGGGLVFLINAGSLTLNGTVTPDSSGRGVVFDGAGNNTVNGVISDGANYNFLFIQQGVGTTTLTAANTYKGTTDIRAGTLLVNGSLASASVVTVKTNATLVVTARLVDRSPSRLARCSRRALASGGLAEWPSATR